MIALSSIMSSAAWMGLSQAAMYLAVVLGATIAIIMLLKFVMWVWSKAQRPLTSSGREREIQEQARFNLAVRDAESRLSASPSFRPLTAR